MNDLMTKSFLNYKDLKKEALKDLESGPDIELTSSLDGPLCGFFEEAEQAKIEMDSIRSLLLHLQQSIDDANSLHNPDSIRSHRDTINSNIVKILRTARSISDKLSSMDRGNAANAPALDRTRSAVTNGLRVKLKEMMMDFQALRQRMMSEYKEAVERRYFTVTGEVATEDMIERIIADGDGEEMVRKAVSGGGRGEVAAAVEEILDRREAAREVERSLLELHQVFLDMAVMVETQGERMDDIEHHVSTASNYVKGGAKELKAAKEHQRSSRKWLCVGIMLLLILILVVLVPILVSFRSS